MNEQLAAFGQDVYFGAKYFERAISFYKPLNYEFLLENEFLFKTENMITFDYVKYANESGLSFFFTGQINNNMQPDGIVRVIYSNGSIYEGQMTPDGLRNGYGVMFQGQ